MTNFVRSTRRVAVVIALVGGMSALVAPSAFAASRQPVDWTVRTTFIGPEGEDVPLRIGQADDAGGSGFGVRHIIQRHDEVPDDHDMQAALEIPGSCEHDFWGDKWECQMDAGSRGVLLLVFTERESEEAGGRPVGIITAFYAPRGCAC